LDAFRKGGDSMLGRYHYYRIHPYTLPELGMSEKNLEALFRFGGFPEPLLDQDVRFLRRWHLQRVAKLVRIDLRDIENVSDLDKVELLANALPKRVSSTLSRKSLAEDLEVSDKTVKRWLEILNSLYFSYSLSPFGAPKIKAIKKSQKVYLWDWSQVESEGPRFENLVASHLLKLCHFEQDVNGYSCELRYIRDESGRECDFVFLKNGKPEFAVECKLSCGELDPGLRFFRERVKIPRWYQVHLRGEDSETIEPGLKRLSFSRFCKEVQAV
jgi:predicted AAA+ superfamily ATPase